MYNPVKYTDPSGHNPIVGILMFLFGLATPIPDLEIVGLAILCEYAIIAGIDAPGLAAFAETTYYYADNVANGGGGSQTPGNGGVNFGGEFEPPSKRDLSETEDVADYFDYWSRENPDRIIEESSTEHFWEDMPKGYDYQDVIDILQNGKKFTDARINSNNNLFLWDSSKNAYIVIDRFSGDLITLVAENHLPNGAATGWFDISQMYILPGFPVYDTSDDWYWGN
jgi:hypothetical protein